MSDLERIAARLEEMRKEIVELRRREAEVAREAALEAQLKRIVEAMQPIGARLVVDGRGTGSIEALDADGDLIWWHVFPFPYGVPEIDPTKWPSFQEGDAIYPHRPDLYAKWFWRCVCGAYVGCHRDTQEPMGTPAGPATRKARGEAHAAFDALWKRKVARDRVSAKEARTAGYTWLAQQMGLDTEDTHIARFTVYQCQRVVELCRPYLPKTSNSSG